MIDNKDPNYFSKGCFFIVLGLFAVYSIVVIISFVFEGDSYSKEFLNEESGLNINVLQGSFILVVITGLIFAYNYFKGKK
jgi:hypothetical protein